MEATALKPELAETNIDVTLDITKFTDYRMFLLAHVQDCKRKNRRWTYGVFARQLKLKDTSSITKIIQGQREPGPHITEELIRYFHFSSTDAQYFQDLVRLQKIKQDPRLTVLLIEKMGKKYPGIGKKLLDDRNFEIISNWYCTAIREMVTLDQFFEDPNWIAKKLEFRVTPSEVSHAIELLIESELLARDSRGKLILSNGCFNTPNDLSTEGIKRYHESMLDIAKSAIRKFDAGEREFYSSVFTMSLARFQEAKELIREFSHRFLSLLEEDKGNVTVQMQVQFFPLTKIKDEEPLQ